MAPSDHNARNREYQREKRKDPAFRAAEAIRKREYRARLRADPEWCAREEARKRRHALDKARNADPYARNKGWDNTPWRNDPEPQRLAEALRSRHRFLRATGKVR